VSDFITSHFVFSDEICSTTKVYANIEKSKKSEIVSQAPYIRGIRPINYKHFVIKTAWDPVGNGCWEKWMSTQKNEIGSLFHTMYKNQLKKMDRNLSMSLL
jgi:hypothetical protein